MDQLLKKYGNLLFIYIKIVPLPTHWNRVSSNLVKIYTSGKNNLFYWK